MLMREMARGLVRRGYGTTIVVPAWDSTVPFAEDCRARGLHVERTHWLEEREPRALAYYDAARLALRFRAPMVHYHLSTNVMPGRYVRPVQLLGSRPAVVTLHDPYDEPAAESPAASRWARTAARLFERVICVSRTAEARQLRYGLPRDRVGLIYNGIDVERFGQGRGDRIRGALRLDPSAPVILVSSRIAAQKRPLDAVRAFARIAQEFPTAHLVFVGDGPLRDATETEASRLGLGNRVHLPGYRTDLEDWLAAATVWLLPTESEGFSLAIIEAMAAGCAIVTTMCPGNDEVLEHDRNALLTPIGDVDGIANALRNLLRDEHLRERLGDEARRNARQFSLDRMMNEYLDVYASAGWMRAPVAARARGGAASAAVTGTGPAPVRRP